jgi:site-specific DNA-cytosine methylase
VVTACSGGETFSAGLDIIGQPFEVLGMSERDPASRRVLRRLHPAAPLEPDACRACWPFSCDLFLLGFPCNKYSGLNRTAVRADLEWSLLELHQMLEYVRQQSPSVVVLENIASLLSSRTLWVFDRVCDMLLGIPGYTWHAGTVCPGFLGGAAYRARLFWVGVRSELTC